MSNTKNYLITFGVSLVVMIAILILVLIIMLPKQSSTVKGTINSYNEISKSEYTFESTKDISSQPLTRKYSVSSDDMNTYKTNSQYQTGNTDPFKPVTDTTTSNSTSTTTTANNTNSTSSQATQQAQQKTTNSNGGGSNPPATSK